MNATAPHPGKIHIGLSGFAYKPWQGEGRFYPPKLKANEYLAYYGTRYGTVEGDGTWYRLPSEETIASWSAAVPSGFKFCPKMHRKVTHLARLLEEGDEVLAAFVSRMNPLAEVGKMGAILVQLPPNLGNKDDRLARFLARLPYRFECGEPVKYAFEFRNETWKTPEVLELLTGYGAAWVSSDTDDAEAEILGSAFHYVRLRKSDYSVEDLEAWVAKFRRISELGRELYVFCKHEDEGHPWVWADYLLGQLGGS